MAMSGVTLASGVAEALSDLRMKKSRYVVLSIGADGKQIGVEEVGARDVKYADFAKKLAERATPAYVGFDIEVDGKGKPILISWIPDTAKARDKMMYSSSREALTPVLEGYMAVQANDASELAEEEVAAKVKTHRTN